MTKLESSSARSGGTREHMSLTYLARVVAREKVKAVETVVVMAAVRVAGRVAAAREAVMAVEMAVVTEGETEGGTVVARE